MPSTKTVHDPDTPYSIMSCTLPKGEEKLHTDVDNGKMYQSAITQRTCQAAGGSERAPEQSPSIASHGDRL
jgi:hypothetical protein